MRVLPDDRTALPNQNRAVGEFLRVSVGEFDVAAGSQQFAIFQPDEVRLWDAGGHAAEDCAAPC